MFVYINANEAVISRFLLTIGCLFITYFTWAQSFTLEGRVIDEQNRGIAFANVFISKSTDSTIITGSTTDDDGNFIIQSISGGEYVLKVSFIGFKDVEQAIDLKADLVLPPIILIESAETLSEVEITVKKPTLVRKPDRLVFNVQNTTLTEGNVMDVVSRTPGVLVLGDDITVKNSNPEFYINDRKVNLNSSDIMQLLEGTSASTIQSIEVITNPSARYDADSGTIINIVMLKNLVTGYQGSVFARYIQGVFPKYNLGTSQFLKNKSTSFFLNYSYNDQKIDRENNEQIFYPEDTWRSLIDRNTWSDTHTVNFNFDADLGEYDRLSISSNMLFLPYFKYLTRNTTKIDPAPLSSFASFNADNLSRDLKHNMGFNVDYEHRFKKNDSRLIVNGHATLYDYRRNQSVESEYFLEDGSFFERNVFRTRADQHTAIYTGQIDYQLPIDDDGSVETGVKYSKVDTESNILQKNIINDIPVIDEANTDMFDYDEQVYAAYMNFSNSWGKFSLNAGLRLEQTELEGKSASLEKANTQEYLEWFPSASIGYEIGERSSIYSSYKRSITRPNFRNLNPFRFFLNDNTIVTGNPALQPIFTNHFIIGTSIGDHIFEFYYLKRKNNITELPIQDNDSNIVTYTPINFNSTDELGFDYTVSVSPIEDWSVFFATSFYYTKDQIGWFNGENVERDIWASYSQLSNSFSLLKDKSLNLDIDLFYISKNIQGLQTVAPMFFSEVSLKKTAFNGKGIFSLGVEDLFNEQDYLVSTRFLDQNNTNYSKLDNRLVSLGFRYTFGNTKLSSTEQTLNKEERERLD